MPDSASNKAQPRYFATNPGFHPTCESEREYSGPDSRFRFDRYCAHDRVSERVVTVTIPRASVFNGVHFRKCAGVGITLPIFNNMQIKKECASTLFSVWLISEAV